MARASVAPALVGVGSVLGLYSETASHWSVLARPLLILVICAMAAALLGWVVTRGPGSATIAASAGMLGLLGHLDPHLAVVLGAGALATGLWMRLTHRRARSPLRLAMTLAVAYALVGTGMVAVSGAVTMRDIAPSLSFTSRAIEADGALPDIYVILLDGYARPDWMETTFRYDVSPFVAALEERGFDYYPNATTPSDRTGRALFALLSGSNRALPPLAAAPTAEAHLLEVREMRRRLASAPATAFLRNYGYELVTITSPVTSVAIHGWDRMVDTGQINDLEAELLARSPVAPALAAWVWSQQVDRITATLDAVVPRPGWREVVFAHVMSPHPPFVLARGASPVPCWPERCGLFDVAQWDLELSVPDFSARYVAETSALNALVIDALDRIVGAAPEAVVVVMSDHGARYPADDVDERHATLLAVRSPGVPRLLGDRETIVGLLVRIVERYHHP